MDTIIYWWPKGYRPRDQNRKLVGEESYMVDCPKLTKGDSIHVHLKDNINSPIPAVVTGVRIVVEKNNGKPQQLIRAKAVQWYGLRERFRVNIEKLFYRLAGVY